MCGICAYINYMKPRSRKEIIEILIKGLKRQEYRGYDSAGLAIDGDDMLGNTICPVIIRTPGKVAELDHIAMGLKEMDYTKMCDNHCGISHTRWATHGEPCSKNSHPQSSDSTDEFLCVHNGIISNHKYLKDFLASKGYLQRSETDTEIIVMLMKYLKDKNCMKSEDHRWNLVQLLYQTIRLLEGAFSIVVKSRLYPGECVVARRSSPLIIGMKSDNHSEDKFVVPVILYSMNQDCEEIQMPKNIHLDTINNVYNGSVEYFIASDASAIIEHTKKVIYLEEGDIAVIKNGNLQIHRSEQLNKQMDQSSIVEFQTLQIELQQIMKGNYSSFMEKEIFEQPETVFTTMRGRVNYQSCFIELGGIRPHMKTLKLVNRIILIGCGTSFYSALAVRKFLEDLSQISVAVESASDFLDRNPCISRNDACFFISQSGETADTLSALRYCKNNDAILVGVTNVVGSSISRETLCGVHVNAGPEICVASTKAYTSQIIAMMMIACKLAEDSIQFSHKITEFIENLKDLPSKIQQVLSCNNEIKDMAQKLCLKKTILFMGRGCHFATCLEAALKIKEITYIHSEGILTGELKHGPLALVDEDMPIVMIIMDGSVFDKSINALRQVIARKAKPWVVTDCWEKINVSEVSGVIKLPRTMECLQPILAIIPFQLLSLYIARMKNLDVDFPRNLAKSVTVE